MFEQSRSVNVGIQAKVDHLSRVLSLGILNENEYEGHQLSESQRHTKFHLKMIKIFME